MSKRLCLSWLLYLLLEPSTIRAQGAAFTYQGRLVDAGQPANGTYDLRLAIANAAANGDYVGAPLTNASVLVSNGFLSLTLDFGPTAFDGSPRWLEIGVRTNGSRDPYTPLQPRQQITAAPYATFASAAATATVASNLTAGASISVNGAGVTNINGAHIQAGTINSNKLDAATAAQLALAGAGIAGSTNFGDVVASSLFSTNISGDVLHATNQFAPVLALAGLCPKPAMIWNSYATWNMGEQFTHFAGEYESNFVSRAQAIATNGLLAAGYNIAWLDYFWGDRPTLQDTLTNDTFKFPHGISWLANVCHTNGLKFGIYICWGTNSGGLRPTTCPYSVARDISLFASWGVDAVKFDGAAHHDYPQFNDRDAAILVANCIRATGRNMIVDLTCPHTEHAPDDALTPDLFPMDIPLNVEIWELSNVQELAVPVSQTMRAANYFEPIAWANGPGHCGQLVWVYQKDAGLVELTNDINFDVMWPSPLMIGEWNGNLRYYTNAEIIAIDQDPAVIPHSVLYRNSGSYIWGRPLGLTPNPIPSLDRTYRKADTNAVLFINANSSGSPVSLTVTSAMLKQPTNTLFWVRDPWQHSYLGNYIDTFTVTVPANSSALYVLIKPPWTNAPRAGQVLKFDGTFMYWADP